MAISFDDMLIPVRMLAQYAYCKRLAYLEWVQGEFEYNTEVVEGKYAHRKVDQESGARKMEQADTDEKIHARSVIIRRRDHLKYYVGQIRNLLQDVVPHLLHCQDFLVGLDIHLFQLLQPRILCLIIYPFSRFRKEHAKVVSYRVLIDTPNR